MDRPEIFKKSSKTGDRLAAISNLQNNEERVLIQARNGQLSKKYPEKVYSRHVPKNWKYTFLVNSWNFKGVQLSTLIEIFKNCLQEKNPCPHEIRIF